MISLQQVGLFHLVESLGQERKVLVQGLILTEHRLLHDVETIGIRERISVIVKESGSRLLLTQRVEIRERDFPLGAKIRTMVGRLFSSLLRGLIIIFSGLVIRLFSFDIRNVEIIECVSISIFLSLYC